jgi:chromate transporter
MSEVFALFLHFLMLCSLAVGGLSTVMPEIQRYVVDERGLISAREFADVYALGQAAPGPNALWVPLVGLQAAGWTGALAATVAVFLPATVFSLVTVSLHMHKADSPFAVAVRRGLAPVALGFMFAAGWVLLQSLEHGWQGYAISIVSLVVVLRTRVNPLWLMAAGAGAGIAGFA